MKQHDRKIRRSAVISGAYGMSNVGDEAVLEAMLAQLRSVDPAMDITILSRSPRATTNHHGVKAIHSFRLGAVLRAMRRAEIFISGGGSLVQDNTSSRSLWYYLYTMWAAWRRDCRVILYGCGIGPVKRRFDRRLARWVLNRYTDVITLRDPDSVEELESLGVTRPEIVLSSDPALGLPDAPAEEVDALAEAIGLRQEGKYLCLCLREWEGMDERAGYIAEAADRAAEELGLEPVFLSVNARQDGAIARAVAGRMRHKALLVDRDVSPGVAAGLIGRMSVVLSVRLHALIFAASRGVPVVGLSYDPKVAAFLDYIGQSNYRELAALDSADELYAMIERAAGRDRALLRAQAERLHAVEGRNTRAVRCALGIPEVGQPARRRIALFQSDFQVGGIQKALVNILEDIDYDRCEVDVFVYSDNRFFDVPEKEHLRFYSLRPYPYVNRLLPFGLVWRLARRRPSLREYDVAIDFNSYRNECAVGALSARAARRVMWIHNDVDIKRRNEPKYRVLWFFFRRKLRYYDEFCAVSPGIIDGFRRMNDIYDKPITSIPNHINTEEILRRRSEPVDFTVREDEYNLCTVGRICRQKGFDILMDIFAEVRARRQDIHLYLIGDGPDRPKLEKQIRRLGLASAVTLLGNQPNPFPYMDRMDGFALTSRYEGQGLVIWEAKTLGLELFLSENLEKYNPGIAGRHNLVDALCHARRREKQTDDLGEYNRAITASLDAVLGL